LRCSKEEAAIKNFGSQLSYEKHVQLIDTFNEHIKKIAHQSKLPTFTIAGKCQKGKGFGERLQNAYQEVFDKGYDNVIAIGNDCLTIDKDVLINAAQSLQKESAVIGPTKDGGTYLLGLDRNTFEQINLTSFSWQTDKVFNEIIDCYQSLNLSFQLLEEAEDADDFLSLWRILNLLPNFISIKKQLRIILARTQTTIILFVKNIITLLFSNKLSLRGPPQLV